MKKRKKACSQLNLNPKLQDFLLHQFQLRRSQQHSLKMTMKMKRRTLDSALNLKLPWLHQNHSQVWVQLPKSNHLIYSEEMMMTKTKIPDLRCHQKLLLNFHLQVLLLRPLQKPISSMMIRKKKRIPDSKCRLKLLLSSQCLLHLSRQQSLTCLIMTMRMTTKISNPRRRQI